MHLNLQLRKTRTSSNVDRLKQDGKLAMWIRSFSFICLIISLISCSRMHHTTHVPIQTNPQNRVMPAFNRVQVDGNIDVTLNTGAPNPRALLHGDPTDLAHVKMSVKYGLLHIEVDNGYPHHGAMHVDIHTHYLNAFKYTGKGTIIGTNLHSRLLDLSIANKGSTRLQGQIAVHNLTIVGPGYTQIKGITGQMLNIKIKGNARVQLAGMIDATSLNIKDGWLSLYWVDSKALRIRARGHSFVQMAGRVQTLDIELWDKARFNGRYLRGSYVFTKTHNESIADINVLKRRHSLATDTSNIYFHNLPDMKTDFMAYNGSVLDLREWYVRGREEPTRYNRE